MSTNVSPPDWRPAMVTVDNVFLGPYPALVPTDPDPSQPLIARFSYQVLQRMHLDTHELAKYIGRLVIASGGKVWLANRHHRKIINRQRINVDADGLYGLASPIAQWSIVDFRWERHGECECGSCPCPQTCAICEEPVGGLHATHCAWAHGSSPWEHPQVSASPAVLPDHRHWTGCAYLIRRPGQLFGGALCSLCGKPVCSCCGEHGSRLSHTLATADRFEHHERCRNCHQVWHATAV